MQGHLYACVHVAAHVTGYLLKGMMWAAGNNTLRSSTQQHAFLDTAAKQHELQLQHKEMSAWSLLRCETNAPRKRSMATDIHKYCSVLSTCPATAQVVCHA
jgi:hypothetical protein